MRPVTSLGIAASIASFAIVLPLSDALADHNWGAYHWYRATVGGEPKTVELGDNLSNGWGHELIQASNDWSKYPDYTKIKTVVGGGETSDTSTCAPTAGRVEVCNIGCSRRGPWLFCQGWVGLASIWVDGDAHIEQGTVQVNDAFFDGTLNTLGPAWRQYVMCQEVGHTLPLGHIDEDFSTPTNTCMDYTNNVSNTFAQAPYDHDYDELAKVYNDHGDGIENPPDPPPEEEPKGNGGNKGGKNKGAEVFFGHTALPLDASSAAGDLFVRELGNGRAIITHVIWGPQGKAVRVPAQ